MKILFFKIPENMLISSRSFLELTSLNCMTKMRRAKGAGKLLLYRPLTLKCTAQSQYGQNHIAQKYHTGILASVMKMKVLNSMLLIA